MLHVEWDESSKGTAVTLSNNNLTAHFSTSRSNVRSTASRSGSGKYYLELTMGASSNNYVRVGVCPINQFVNNSFISTGVNYLGGTGEIFIGNVVTIRASTFRTGDVISVLVDFDNNQIEFKKNDISQGIVHDASIGEQNNWVVIAGYNSTGNTGSVTANFGASPFQYLIPKGYRSFDNRQPARFLFLTENNNVIAIDQTDDSVTEIPSQTEEDFNNFGVSDLSSINFRNKFNKKIYVNNQSNQLGSGKVFEQDLDLKKHINSIRIY